MTVTVTTGGEVVVKRKSKRETHSHAGYLKQLKRFEVKTKSTTPTKTQAKSRVIGTFG